MRKRSFSFFVEGQSPITQEQQAYATTYPGTEREAAYALFRTAFNAATTPAEKISLTQSFIADEQAVLNDRPGCGPSSAYLDSANNLLRGLTTTLPPLRLPASLSSDERLESAKAKQP